MNSVEAEVEYSFVWGGKSYTFDLQRIQFSGDSPQATGLDTDVMLNLTGLGLFDDVTGTPLTITRVT